MSRSSDSASGDLGAALARLGLRVASGGAAGVSGALPIGSRVGGGGEGGTNGQVTGGDANGGQRTVGDSLPTQGPLRTTFGENKTTSHISIGGQARPEDITYKDMVGFGTPALKSSGVFGSALDLLASKRSAVSAGDRAGALSQPSSAAVFPSSQGVPAGMSRGVPSAMTGRPLGLGSEGGETGAQGLTLSPHHGTYVYQSSFPVETVMSNPNDVGSIQDSRSYMMVEDRKPPPPDSLSQVGVPKTVVLDSASVDSKMTPLKTVEYLPVRLDDFHKVCRGVIGKAGETMCIAKDCTKSHMGGVASVMPGDLFVVSQPNKTVYLYPRLAAATVDASMVAEFLGQKKRIDEWVQIFDRIIRAAEIGVPVTREAMKMVTEEEEASLAFKTPRAKNKRSYDETMVDLGISPYRKTDIDPEEMESLSHHERFAKVVEVVEALDTGVDQLGSHSVKFNEGLKHLEEEQERISRMLEIKIDIIRRELGRRNDVAVTNLGVPDIWSGLAKLSTQAESKVAEESPRDEDKLSSLFLAREQAIMDSIAKLDIEVKSVTSGLTQSVSAAGSRLDDLERLERIQRMDNETEALILQSLHDVHERINQVDVQVKRVKTGEAPGVAQFGDTGIDSVQSAKAWMEVNLATAHIGLIVTPHSIMEQMYAKIEGDKFMNAFIMLHKLELESRQQGYAMTAFEKGIPKLLSKKDDEAIPNDMSYFDRMKDWLSWDLHETGTRARWKNRMMEVETALRRSISNSLKVGSPAHVLAIQALVASVSFCEGLFKFFDDYTKYLTMAKFHHSKAWHISTRLGYRLLLAIFEPCIGVMDDFKTNDLKQVTSTMLYANLQSLDIAVKIKEDKFTNSPLVAGELVKFLAVNTGFEAIEKLEESLKKLEKKVDDLKADVSTATKASTSAANKADNVKSSLEALAKRVGALEKNPKLKA